MINIPKMCCIIDAYSCISKSYNSHDIFKSLESQALLFSKARNNAHEVHSLETIDII